MKKNSFSGGIYAAGCSGIVKSSSDCKPIDSKSTQIIVNGGGDSTIKITQDN